MRELTKTLEIERKATYAAAVEEHGKLLAKRESLQMALLEIEQSSSVLSFGKHARMDKVCERGRPSYCRDRRTSPCIFASLSVHTRAPLLCPRNWGCGRRATRSRTARRRSSALRQ